MNPSPGGEDFVGYIRAHKDAQGEEPALDAYVPAQVVGGVVSAIYSPSYSPDFVAPCLETMDTFTKFSEFYADSHWDVIRDSFTNWVPETSVNGNLPVLARIVSNVVIDIA